MGDLRETKRCGNNAFEARELCVDECTSDSDCIGGQECQDVDPNYCHCLGDSSYNEGMCGDKSVEFVSRDYSSANDATTFTYRITDSDSNSANRPKDISIGWTGTCCVESADYFSDENISGGENSDTCVKGITYGAEWEPSYTQGQLFTLVVAGDVPQTADASTISVNMMSGSFCLFELPGPSCDCEPGEIVFQSENHIAGDLD